MNRTHSLSSGARSFLRSRYHRALIILGVVGVQYARRVTSAVDTVSEDVEGETIPSAQEFTIVEKHSL